MEKWALEGTCNLTGDKNDNEHAITNLLQKKITNAKSRVELKTYLVCWNMPVINIDFEEAADHDVGHNK